MVRDYVKNFGVYLTFIFTGSSSFPGMIFYFRKFPEMLLINRIIIMVFLVNAFDALVYWHHPDAYRFACDCVHPAGRRVS